MRTKRVAALATGAAAIVGGLVVKNKKQKARAQQETSSSNGASSNGLRMPTASSMTSDLEDEYADLRDS